MQKFVSWKNPLTSRLTEIQTQPASQTNIIHAWLVKSFAGNGLLLFLPLHFFSLSSMSV